MTITNESAIQRPRTLKSGRPVGDKALAIRGAVIGLMDEYDVMTVRQVFYALVSRGVVPKDEGLGYRAVQKQVLLMRKNGNLPWHFIADGSRWMRKPASHDRVEDAIAQMNRTYRRNLWQSHDVRVEVWLEKDALAGVVMDVTNKWDVPLMVSRGTSSATFLYSAAQSAAEAWQHDGIETFVYTLYDYDAGGARAARTVTKGFAEYAPGTPVTVGHIAVTEAQVEEWSLQTRPAKMSDPEAKSWGGRAVELDAVPPDLLLGLVENTIVSHIDADAWEKEKLVEESERIGLTRLLHGAA